MNHKISLSTLVAVTLLSAGCVGTGPNTQQGAVLGGALGAIAGAALDRGHLGGAILGAEAGAIAGGTLGNSVDHQNGTIYGSDDPSVVVVADPNAPAEPAPLAEVVTPCPGDGYVWISGYWNWNGYQYFWCPGLWSIVPYGYGYIAPYWGWYHGHRVFYRGHWERGHGYGYGHWRHR
jgi:hypothetical protein